jgi:hypothetical protein
MFKLSKDNKLDFLLIHKKSRHIYDDVSFVKNWRFRARLFVFLKYFSIFVIFLAIVGLIFFISYFKDIKAFYENAMSGKDNIEKAVELILAEKYQEGGKMAALADEDFSLAVDLAEKYQGKVGIRHISYFRTQADDLKYLALSAEIISRAIRESAEYANAFETILARKDRNFNQLSTEDKKKLLELIYKSSPELAGIKANIDLALMNLDNISYSGVLLPFRSKLNNIETQLAKVQSGLEAIIPLSNFLPVVFGYPEKATYLFLLQNSDELRPTGGFIGTYGILQTEYGDILRMDTHDIYHLDMPVKDVYGKVPPAPLKQYLGVDKWYMRDSNWSPDWPTSAKLAEKFFYEEDALLPAKDQINNFKGEFDGVIAITPKIITDLLARVGPVYVQGTEFNQDNFVDLLQYKVEQEYMQLGISSWHRKAIIGEVVKELKIKLFDLSPNNLYAVLDVFENNLTEKNILLYFNDQGFEEIARDKGWTGEIISAPADYLMVVDANMASYKTDAVMKRGLRYDVNISGGQAKSKLLLNYSHHGGFDWKTTRYQTYTRVYVPRGSQLISIKGSEGNKAEVYDELGKTVFAYLLRVEPGAIANIEIEYRLPQVITKNLENNNYSLYIQKQPGKELDELDFSLRADKKIDSYAPTGFFSEQADDYSVSWNTELSIDRGFEVRLRK